MLMHLHIRNFAIVPSLEQDFRAGFTAISGETGAGKSILVDALSLLLGARSDASWVRSGADRAELSAQFGLEHNAPARTWLEEHELQDQDNCLLRRTIKGNGRSNAWINGTPVTVQQLSELGNLLVEVHGQNEHIRLTGRKRQLALLDETGKYKKHLDAVRSAWTKWRDLDDRIRELEANSSLPPGESEFLGFQLKELKQHALPPEEVKALDQENRLLASAGDLLQALDDSIESLENQTNGAAPQLSTVIAQMAPFADLDPELGEAQRMLTEALINVQEASANLTSASGNVDVSPARMEQVASTLSVLGDLARKHGVQLEELENVRDNIARRLESAGNFQEQHQALRLAREEALLTYGNAARELGNSRKKHARALAGKVEKVMTELGMDGGSFSFQLLTSQGDEPSENGQDRVEIQVSANAGVPAASIAKVASGGELSRISLAIKVVTASGAGRTQVFDEIDSGVGGDTANAVGRMLGKTAENGQALCVTHLAQVAVRADQQLQVMKESVQDETSVDARLLTEQERIEEIARMLGGEVSRQSRAHAREMLESAKSSVH